MKEASNMSAPTLDQMMLPDWLIALLQHLNAMPHPSWPGQLLIASHFTLSSPERHLVSGVPSIPQHLRNSQGS